MWPFLGRNWSLYWDSHQSGIRLHIGAGIYAVHTADTVATGEVNCNNILVRLRSLPRFAEAIIQGTCSAAQRPLAREDGTRRYLCRLEDSSMPCGRGQTPITCQRKHLLSAASSVSLYYAAVDRQCRHRWLLLAGTSIFTTRQRSPYRRDNTVDPCWSLRVSWSGGL